MADDTNDVLLVESHGAVRLLTLNRPDAFNATNEDLHGALANVWARLAADEEMLALVITGAGHRVLRRRRPQPARPHGARH